MTKSPVDEVVSCACGQRYRVRQAVRGREFACRSCGETVGVASARTTDPRVSPHSQGGSNAGAVRFPCGHCGQSLRVPAGAEGKRMKCPSCRRPLTVPRLSDSPRNPQPLPGEKIRFACEHCGEYLRAPRHLLGRRLSCPRCRKSSIVSDEMGSANSPSRPLPSADISDLLDEIEATKKRQEPDATRTCSHCGTDVFGEVSRCPVCNRRMPIDLPVESRPKKSSRQTTRWTVGLGLSLVYYAVMLWFVGSALIFVGTLARSTNLIYGAVILGIVTEVMVIVGKALCLAVPVQHGKGFAVLAVAMQCASLALSFQPKALGVQFGGFPAEMLAYLVSLAAWLLFLVFLRKLCEPLKQPGLTHAADQLYHQAVTLFVALPLFLPILLIFVGPFLVLFVPAGIFTAGACLVYAILIVRFLIGYLQLLSYLKVTLLP